jgi:hypothetical protein
MSDVKAATIDAGKRPVPITIVCIIGFIGVIATVPLMLSDAASSIAPWYPPALGVSALIGLTCMIGLWMMRKWAVYAYTAFFAITQGILIATGLWSVSALVLPAVVIVVMFVYLSRMR